MWIRLPKDPEDPYICKLLSSESPKYMIFFFFNLASPLNPLFLELLTLGEKVRI